MAGKARDKYGLGKKLKHQQDTNKELYNISGLVPTQASSSIVSAGSQGGGTYQNAQSADIYMNTYDIVDVDRLKFATKEGAGDALTTDDYGIEALYSGTNAYGIQMSVPATKNINFKRGTDIPISITTSNVTFGDDIQVSSFADFVGVSTPADPASTARRLFSDSGNSNHLSVRTNGGSTIDLEAGSSGASTALDNLTDPTAINQHLIPTSDNSKDLGSEDNEWRNLYVDGFAYLDHISLGGAIDMNDQEIVDVGCVEFRKSVTTPASNKAGINWDSSGNMEFDVPTSNDAFEFKVAGTQKVFITGSGQIQSDSWLGGFIGFTNPTTNGIITEVKFHDVTNFTQNTSSGASSAGTYNGNILSPQGYIEIKVNGTDYTIPYYST